MVPGVMHCMLAFGLIGPGVAGQQSVPWWRGVVLPRLRWVCYRTQLRCAYDLALQFVRVLATGKGVQPFLGQNW